MKAKSTTTTNLLADNSKTPFKPSSSASVFTEAGATSMGTMMGHHVPVNEEDRSDNDDEENGPPATICTPIKEAMKKVLSKPDHVMLVHIAMAVSITLMTVQFLPLKQKMKRWKRLTMMMMPTVAAVQP